MQKVLPLDHWIRSRPIAHRGLHDHSNNTPENSLKAFDAACKKKFPIELDVRLTSDGKAAVFHDMTLSRMSGIKKWISSLHSDNVKKINLLGSDEKIPLLEDALDLIRGRVPVLVEIKRHLLPGTLENSVIQALKSYKGDSAVLTFNPVALRYIHTSAPEIISGINIGKAEKLFFEGLFLNRLINNFSSPDFISYSTRGGMPKLSSSFFRKINLPILAWTVKSIYEEQKAREFADNIIFENYIPT